MAEEKQTKTSPKEKVTKSTLSATMYGTDGKEAGTINLPEIMFDAKVNPVLMSQAVRVYLANQRQGTRSTQTRGDVTMTTAKVYRQKGTGRARHGAKSAPIFVKGGVAHGPKPQDFSLKLSKKMKKAALFSSLTAKLKDQELRFVEGFDTLEPKTKPIAKALNEVAAMSKRKILLVVPNEKTQGENITKGARNIAGVTLTPATQINTYEVLNNKMVIITKAALEAMEKHFLAQKES